MKKSGFHRRPGCQVQKFGYVVVSFVIQDNQMSEKAKKTKYRWSVMEKQNRQAKKVYWC